MSLICIVVICYWNLNLPPPHVGKRFTYLLVYIIVYYLIDAYPFWEKLYLVQISEKWVALYGEILVIREDCTTINAYDDEPISMYLITSPVSMLNLGILCHSLSICIMVDS